MRLEICLFKREQDSEWEKGILIDEGDKGILTKDGELLKEVYTWKRSYEFAIELDMDMGEETVKKVQLGEFTVKEKDAGNKICPILSLALKAVSYCQKGSCAFWEQDSCALVKLSGRISSENYSELKCPKCGGELRVIPLSSIDVCQVQIRCLNCKSIYEVEMGW